MSSSAIELSIDAEVTSEATTTIGQAGSSQAFSIRDPYLGVTWLISTVGVFPSRS